MMLIENEPPSEKQLLKASNSITTKLIRAGDSSNYSHLQLYNQSLSDQQKMSQYQLSPAAVGSQLPMLNNQNALNRALSAQQHQMSNGLNQSLNHGTIRPHNQAAASQLNGGYATHRSGIIMNGGFTPLQNSIISNYATISRAAHNQLNGGGVHLNNTPTTLLTTQVPNSQLHLNTQAIYQQLTPLNAQINHINQFQLANGIYGAPQFGLEVGLDLHRNNRSCCFCFYGRCNISRVIAFICGLVVLFLMSLTISTSNWLTADKYQQGLFQFCVDEGAETPLPFGLNVQPGHCYPGRDTEYIRILAGLCCFGFILDLLATLMTGFGLCSTNPYKKYSLYKFALYIMIASLIFILSALVIYPAFFASEIEHGNRQIWEFGWSYGVGWGSCIFLIGAILLLLCDRESSELYYRERTIVHNPGIREVKA